ncbi:MAG: type II toxin-antitoxin system VapC family toxin [Spirochaetaceae bacterium]|nr:MAG: type II toxin-antitoxin system VapC family toxin [Spirochaetaceae bacterium]
MLVDVNILLYAEDATSPNHEAARLWWDEQLSGTDSVYLSWPVLTAFIRIGTNRRVFRNPLTIGEAAERVQSWLDQPCTRIITPTERHWIIFRELLEKGQATANLVADAHLATLAIEYGCVLFSTDSDFSRFPGLKWRNPLP